MKNTLFDIEGKIVVVTGALGVLAGGTARYLLGQGAKVVLLARRADALQEAVEEAKRTVSPAVSGCVCDVLNQPDLDRARDRILREHGRIDVLINGAGGNLPGAMVQPGQTVFDLDLQEYDKVIELNLKGSVMPTLTFARAMAERKSGCIVNFSSMASSQAITRGIGYSNAKSAIENFTRWMAMQLAREFGPGLRVNAIAPGFFVSNQNRALLLNPDGSCTERGKQVIAKTPMGRFGETDEICGCIHFLISDAAKFVTGTVVPVDGGFSSFSGV
ncbi:MAG: SDR family oxidoreductase [Lentisphaeria bacterium]|nr:SDR family oxidoreductase [Lentisphaeria bacterium]